MGKDFLEILCVRGIVANFYSMGQDFFWTNSIGSMYVHDLFTYLFEHHRSCMKIEGWTYFMNTILPGLLYSLLVKETQKTSIFLFSILFI